ncbi:MAG: TonB-dependent receptor plug domain-containing protein, partial [Cytophagales bacterium]|nr:TonB-dependent receptor plug domain-containing protein [Cytophagales bacterium]
MKKIFYSCALLCAALTANAQEKSSEELMTLSREELMNIQVVSASKKAENLFDAPLSASVLTGEEIRKAGATSLMEALRLVPGLIVREQTNGNYDIHLRGLDNVPPNSYSVYSANTTTLVMIDNRPVYNYLQGGTFWETLPIDLNDVEKIEVVRGPASALYGPNAVSGVIHILTRKAEKAGLQAVANAQYGTRETLLANASVGYAYKSKVSGTVSGNFQRRGREASYYVTPLDARVGSAADLPLGNLDARYPHPERSMDKYGLNAFLRYAPSAKAAFDLSAGTQDSEVQNAYGENGKTPLNTMTSNTRYADLKGRVYGVSTQFSYLTGRQDPSVGFTGSTFDFSTLDASAEYEIRLQKLSLKPGFSYRRARYDDTRYWDVTRDQGIFSGRYEVVTHAASLRSEYSLWEEKLRLVGGLRLDKFNYPNQWFASYQLAATVKPVAGHLLRAVYSRAYRSPFIYDNFIDLTLALDPARPNFLYQVNGSKDLDLVRSDMFEVGYRGKITGNLHVDAEVYYTQTRNYTDLIMEETEVRESNPVKFITHLYVRNLPLQVNQVGTTVSLNYVQGKVQVKPFVTV